MIEQWKPVVGFEGRYEVSDQGRVRSLDQLVSHWCGGFRLRKGRVLKLVTDVDGYFAVGLFDGEKQRRKRVCRLVLQAFKGAAPSERHQCAHLDGLCANDAPMNLEWKTAKQNAEDKHRHGTTARGNMIGKATQTEGSVARIRDLYSCGVFQTEIACWMNLSQSNVSAIVRKEMWKHV